MVIGLEALDEEQRNIAPPVVTRSVRLGVDIGQAADPTAFAAAEIVASSEGVDYLVRHLRRMPLGTPYPEVAREIVRAAAGLAKRGLGTPSVYVDATGVGAPIIDLIMSPLRELAELRPVIITAGNELRERADLEAVSGGVRPRRYSGLRVGKAYLVGRLKAALQGGHIKAAPSEEFTALQHELLTFETRNAGRTDKYGAMRTGEHDDLAIAMALVVLDDAITEPRELAELNAGLLGGPNIMGWRW